MCSRLVGASCVRRGASGLRSVRRGESRSFQPTEGQYDRGR
jgi:hypothetical protein